MELTREELVERLCRTATEAYDWLSEDLAGELADGVLVLIAEKKAARFGVLNAIHSFDCEVIQEDGRCSCGAV